MAAGGIFSGADPMAHPSEIRKQVGDAEAALILTIGSFFEKVSDLGAEMPIIMVGEERVAGAMLGRSSIDGGGVLVNQDALCALPYSSGTTGASKGVMLTHRNLVANLCPTLFAVEKEMVGQVTTLGLMPFFHIYGLIGICCASLRNKGKLVVMERFELNPIVQEFDLSKLKLSVVSTAAAPLALELLSASEEKFPDVQVREAYGWTEHSCITLTHGDPKREHGISKRNSVGFILPSMEVKFVDPERGNLFPRTPPAKSVSEANVL